MENIQPNIPNSQDEHQEDRSVGAIAKELANGLMMVLRGEFRLASDELRRATVNIRRKALSAGIFATLVVLGVFPLLAFLVIGLGRLFNGNYWLSSLIVGVLLVGGGILGLISSIRAMKLNELSLPETRKSLQSEQQIIRDKVVDLSQRRVS
jgi:uncharacterized membrane protein YqjE